MNWANGNPDLAVGIFCINMEDWQRILKLKRIGIDAIVKSTSLKSEYIRLYKKVFDLNLCVYCISTIRGTFLKFNQLTKPQIKVMSNRKYKFKEGTQIWVPKDGVHYTNDNLTDKVAAEMLKSNPRYARLFAEMPEDGNGPSPDGKPLSKMKKTELQVKLAMLDGITKEELERVSDKKNEEIAKYIKKYKAPKPEATTEVENDGDGSEIEEEAPAKEDKDSAESGKAK